MGSCRALDRVDGYDSLAALEEVKDVVEHNQHQQGDNRGCRRVNGIAEHCWLAEDHDELEDCKQQECHCYAVQQFPNAATWPMHSSVDSHQHAHCRYSYLDDQ